jgi:hypothetical protein
VDLEDENHIQMMVVVVEVSLVVAETIIALIVDRDTNLMGQNKTHWNFIIKIFKRFQMWFHLT